MSIYKVIGHYIRIEEINIDTAWKEFLYNKNDHPICDFYFGSMRYTNINRDLKVVEASSKRNILECDGTLMISNEEYSVAYVQKGEKETYNTFLNFLFYSHAVNKNMLQLHCSIIEDRGRGLIFLGPSGIGKTTQAECWEKYCGSTIINGDIGFVQRKDQSFIAWGTPWHGSSSYCLNTSVPLKALIILKQAPQNSIRLLQGFEKVAAVSKNVFYPTWLTSGIELCMETLNYLLTMIPVYELSCRPDEGAVRLTEETVFGKDIV